MVQARSSQFRDVLNHLRGGGQDNGYTFSFELGTLTEPNTRTDAQGVTVQELTEYTTLGLYKDLEVEAENNDDALESKAEEPEDHEEDTCSICQERLTTYSIIRQIDRCNHFFHQACIEKWLGEHTTCPLCMQNIKGDEESIGETGRETDRVNNDVPTGNASNNVQERLLDLVARELGI